MRGGFQSSNITLSWARLQTVSDLVDTGGWSPTHASKHGTEVLAMLSGLDVTEKRERLAGNKQRADAKKAVTAERKRLENQAKTLETARIKAQKALQPPKKRASRVKPKPKPSALANVSNTALAPPIIHLPGAHSVLAHPYPSFPPAYPPPPPDFDAPLPFASLNNFDFDDTMAGPSDPLYTDIPQSQFDVHMAGPSNHLHVPTDDYDSYDPPQYLLHDEFGRPLQNLPATSFYGTQFPPQFIPGHHSTYAGPSTPHSLGPDWVL
ncbi:hypothetical protein B0H10DRAFT_1949506 [Mycena sp. CBHHK59/15]|nr:hypothetical protein B0H10DRAFT_1949506 [Mycena sp. CBHHK59/15]